MNIMAAAADQILFRLFLNAKIHVIKVNKILNAPVKIHIRLSPFFMKKSLHNEHRYRQY